MPVVEDIDECGDSISSSSLSSIEQQASSFNVNDADNESKTVEQSMTTQGRPTDLSTEMNGQLAHRGNVYNYLSNEGGTRQSNDLLNLRQNENH